MKEILPDKSSSENIEELKNECFKMIKNFEKFDLILNVSDDEISKLVLGDTPDAATL